MKKRSFSAILLVVFSLVIASSLFSQFGSSDTSSQNTNPSYEGERGGGNSTGSVMAFCTRLILTLRLFRQYLKSYKRCSSRKAANVSGDSRTKGKIQNFESFLFNLWF